MAFRGLLVLFILFLNSMVHASNRLDYPVKNFVQNVGEANAIYQNDEGEYFCISKSGVFKLQSGEFQLFYQNNKSISLFNKFSEDELIIAGPKHFSRLTTNLDGSVIKDSLSENLPDGLQFSIPKEIISLANSSYLHVDNRLLEIGNEIIDFGFNDVVYITSINGDLAVQRKNLGLFLHVGNDFKKLNGSETHAQNDIIEIVNMPKGRQLIIYDNKWVLYDGGYFSTWSTRDQRLLRNKKITSVVSNDNGIFIGTANNGIFQYNFTGNYVRTIDEEKGLLSNQINSLYSDKDQNLWACTSNGISHIETNSSFLLIPSSKLDNSSLFRPGTAINVVNDNIYLGTSEGAFVSPIITNSQLAYNNVRKIYNSKGLISELATIDNLCFIAGDEGSMAIVNNSAYEISSNENSNGFLLLNDKEALIESAKTGLNLFVQINRKWRFANPLYGINENVPTILQDNSGKIWALGDVSGIMELPFNEELNTIDVINYSIENVPVEEIYGLFLINGKPILTTSKGIFEFELANLKFRANKKYNDAFGENNRIKYLYQDVAENIWFVSDSETGVLQVDDNGIEKSVFKQTVPTLFPLINHNNICIKELSEDVLLFGAKDGFIQLTKSAIRKPKQLQIMVLKSETYNDGKQLSSSHIYNSKNRFIEITGNSKFPNIRLSVSSNYYVNDNLVEYSYKLNEGEWTNWDHENEISIEAQKGSNIVKVKARIGEDHLSEVLEIPITINQSWYTQNVLKFIFYFITGLLATGILFFGYTKQKMKLEEKEKDAIKLNRKIEKLESSNHDLIDKNDILKSKIISLSEERNIASVLKKFYDESDNEELRKSIKKLMKKLNSNDSEIVETNDLKENPEFFSILKLKFPDLTKKDIKLSNYLRLKLSSKEIAPLMGISVRGVEISRYRLRKKLGLNNDENLPKFLKDLYKKESQTIKPGKKTL